MMPIKWKKEYELNVSVLDAQHKQIFSCLNELEQAMKKGINSRIIEKIFQRTEQYTKRHFGLEEKYMAESNYPGLEKQQTAHKYFITSLNGIVAEFKTNGMSSSVVNSLRHQLTEWLKAHVIGLDVAFGAFLKNCRKDMPPESS